MFILPFGSTKDMDTGYPSNGASYFRELYLVNEQYFIFMYNIDFVIIFLIW